MVSVNPPKELLQYQTDHLVLLIGENPLPNLVAALLLGKKNCQISFIYSKTTAAVANDLKFQLIQHGFLPNKVDFWQVDESDPTSITAKVRDALTAHKAPSAGLHYTGGTKAMAVHAYRTVERWTEKRAIRAVFSYLNSRDLKMVIGPNDPESGESPVNIPVGRAVCLSVNELMALHGWVEQDLERTLRMPLTTAALAELHFSQRGGELWRYWKANVLRAAAYSRRDEQWLADYQLRGLFLHLPAESDLEAWLLKNPALRNQVDFPLLCRQLQAIRAAFGQDTGLDPDNFSIQAAANKAGIRFDGSLMKGLLTHLDGTWLEMHVLSSLQAIERDQPGSMNDMVRNLSTQTVNFELDVVATRGYQLLVFSCTSTAWENTRGNLKKRLFEAFVHARQIGGDEARVALVCLTEEPDKVESQMTEMMKGPNTNDPVLNRLVKVFGRPQLLNLAAEIRDWMVPSQ